MKLNDIRPQIETSGELEEQFFSIEDQGMIFDILRSKMYSNPILAICREISCNARDTHREVGKPDIPIQIHLPNNLEPFYKVKDFGTGISPDRMTNIFIKYTASTKRNDNLQTGGFGLGAKTPFSYSDTFTILTNYNGTQYNYACFIDETKIGKLALLSESPTTEENGTEIIIPVTKSSDFQSFADWTEQATRHWDVKPIIKGNSIQWKTPNFILQGSNWGIDNSTDWRHETKLVIDGIEYPLSIDALKKYADTKLIVSCRGSIILYFGVGELTLSASREQIYLDKPTQDKIDVRLKQILVELKQIVVDKINNFPNFWEANLFYQKDLAKSFYDLTFLKPLCWQGIELYSHRTAVGCPVLTFQKGRYSRKYGTDPNKLSRSHSNDLFFTEKSELFVNDLPLKEPTARHIKKAFDDNPNLETLQIICPTDKVSQADLNTKIHLDKMAPRLLSTITKVSGKIRNPGVARLILSKYDHKISDFRQISYADMEEDANDKILCLREPASNNLVRRRILIKDQKYLNNFSIIDELIDFKTTSLYAVDTSTTAERISEDLSDFQSFETFVNEKILSNKSINFVEIKWANKDTYNHPDENFIHYADKIKKEVEKSDSVALQKLNLHLKLKELRQSKNVGLLSIFEILNGEVPTSNVDKLVKSDPNFNYNKVNDLFNKTYPLLGNISSYSYSYHNAIDHVIHYINLIDKV